MKPVRILIRDQLGRLLQKAPLHKLESLRLPRRADEGVFRNAAWRTPLLQLFRYRPIDDGPKDFEIQQTAGLRLINDGSLIAGYLYWLGPAGYEPAVAKWWSHFCSHASGILEIGANIGYMTVRGSASAGPGVPYTAVEPNPESLRSLRLNLQLNRLEQVNVVGAAVVGKLSSTAPVFYVPTLDTYRASTGAHLGARESTPSHERVVEVPLTEVDALLDGIDLLKLDVEGAELDILASARTRLATQRAVLFVEVLDSAQALRDFLGAFAEEFDYRLFVLAEPLVGITPSEVSSASLWKQYRSRDLLLIPGERAEQVS